MKICLFDKIKGHKRERLLSVFEEERAEFDTARDYECFFEVLRKSQLAQNLVIKE